MVVAEKEENQKVSKYPYSQREKMDQEEESRTQNKNLKQSSV